METTTAISQYELERGKPVPRQRHAIVQANLIGALLSYKDRYNIFPELDVELNGKLYVPDICVYPKQTIVWAAEEELIKTAPLITIEIISPTQTIDQLLKKADIYLSAGVGAAWVVVPALQTITVLKPDRSAKSYANGIITDEATGIDVAVDEIFR